MRISTKPSVYCIDVLNLVRRGECATPGDDDTGIRGLLALLEAAAASLHPSSEFRLFLDGGGRRLPVRAGYGVSVHFSEGESADELILDAARYLKSAGRRAVVVSSDMELLGLAREEGVKCVECDVFLSFCRRAAGR